MPQSLYVKATLAISGYYLTNYPTYHVMADGEALCQKCLEAMAKSVLEATSAPGVDPQWEYHATDINWENSDLCCAHCYDRIPSAYDIL